MTLDFFQVCYDESQYQHCYPFAKIYRNSELTDFFENDLICKLVPESKADYVGVNSWRLRKKRMDGMTPVILRLHNGDDLSEEKFAAHPDADIFNLTPRSKTHQMLAMAAMWHGGPQHNFAWENAMKELKKFMYIPEEVNNPIYENCQVVRTDIYRDYVANCLAPVISFMRSSSVFFADSGYAPKKERDEGPAAVERYRKMTGRQDYPISPFILERLFSIWINDRKYKIVNV